MYDRRALREEGRATYFLKWQIRTHLIEYHLMKAFFLFLAYCCLSRQSTKLRIFMFHIMLHAFQFKTTFNSIGHSVSFLPFKAGFRTLFNESCKLYSLRCFSNKIAHSFSGSFFFVHFLFKPSPYYCSKHWSIPCSLPSHEMSRSCDR